MAALAAKASYTAPHNLASSYSSAAAGHSRLLRNNRASYATNSTYVDSPTDSEFSTDYDDAGLVRNWDEKMVADWLKSINAGQYVDIFRANNITGENLMDIDQAMLKEMGIKKVGDRVRIGSQAKAFRYQEFRRVRISNRDSFATLDDQYSTHTPPSSGSPRRQQQRGVSAGPRGVPPSRTDKGLRTATSQTFAPRGSSRPTSPMIGAAEQQERNGGKKGALVGSSWTSKSKDQSEGSKAGSILGNLLRSTNKHARSASGKNSNLNIDTTAANTYHNISPKERPYIRAIYDDGRFKTLNIDDCKTPRDMILKTLKSGGLNEAHVKSYCFYILEGTEPEPANCRRLTDGELWNICTDTTRRERDRLMLRKIHAGEPEGSQLMTAASITVRQEKEAINENYKRSQAKIAKLTGEPLPSMTYPMTPNSLAERQRHVFEAAKDLERGSGEPEPTPRPRPRRKEALPGVRPESEYVVEDLETWFPEAKEQARRTVRESIRRSKRVSQASSRLSIASNFSVMSGSGLHDAPPVPVISDRWLHGTLARPASNYRASMASTTLDPLDEESPLEPNRESYVSFNDEDEESTIDSSGSATLAITDPDGNTIRGGFFDHSASSTEAGTLNKQLSKAIAEDGEEADDELTQFLTQDTYDDMQYIKGKLIGQGSFGSVYLALHAITAELMAVKCVEMPGINASTNDTKKNNMVEALKREIALLRELKHPHIVQYLGSSTESSTLNIFLEYIPGGSIAKMLVDYGSLNEVMTSGLIRQTLIGLDYLHSMDIIHRDIKGANILVDSHGSVKISDFGISKRVQDSKNILQEGSAGTNATAGGKGRAGGIAANRVSLQGSVFWMAPEVVRQTAYTKKADIWSLGCLIVEMLTGSHPHPNMSQLQAIFKIGGRGAASDPSPEVPEHASEAAKEFLKKTFLVEHELRPEARELQDLAFIKTHAKS